MTADIGNVSRRILASDDSPAIHGRDGTETLRMRINQDGREPWFATADTRKPQASDSK